MSEVTVDVVDEHTENVATRAGLRAVERTVTIKYIAPVDEDSDVTLTDPKEVMMEFVTVTPLDEMGDFFTVENRELTSDELSAVADVLAMRYMLALFFNG